MRIRVDVKALGGLCDVDGGKSVWRSRNSYLASILLRRRRKRRRRGRESSCFLFSRAEASAAEVGITKVDQQSKKRSKKKHAIPLLKVTEVTIAKAILVEGGSSTIAEGGALALGDVPQPSTGSSMPIAKAYTRLLGKLVPST
ncbi:hypothetical protein COCNU_scaffold005346G000030 [Cocos nucifera]|nr:hypothetical protein [Cocos nucifera]